ncbi:MAG: hypothetical protein AAF544_07905 [Bacteroidota bacterium]
MPKPALFHQIDIFISRFMSRISRPAIRVSFGIIFIWFGILKPLGYFFS